MRAPRLLLLACGLLAATASAQGSFTTVSVGDAAIDWTSDGSTLLVSGLSDWATVDVASGTRTPLAPGGDDPVAISDNGLILGVVDDPVSGSKGSGILTAGTWVYLGNLPGATSGCPELGSPYDLSDDGTVAVGLGWDVCAASAYRWSGATGMTALPKESFGSSRANVVSSNNQVIGGWERVWSSSNQAKLWYADGTSVLCALAPWNPVGVGDVWGLSVDGTWACGSSSNSVGPWIYSQATGPIQIGAPPGSSVGGAIPTDISADGKVVIGYEGNFLGSQAWIWTPATGSMWLDDYLFSSLGITPDGPTAFAVKISPDGTKILGTWTAGFPSSDNAFIAEIPPQPTWSQYDVGISPANYLDLDGGGSTSIGQVFEPVVSGIPATTLFAATGISTSSASVPLLGGVVLINPSVIASVLDFAAGGVVTHSVPLPPTTSLWGVTVYLQSLCPDGAQPGGWGLSNGLSVSL